MELLIFILAAILLKIALTLNGAVRAVPLVELRRRARSGHDKSAAAIYKAASYGESLEVLLWIVGSLSAAAVVLIASNLGWWLATALMLIIGFFIFVWRIPAKTSGWQWSLAAFVAPWVSKLLSLLQPVFGRAGNLLKENRPARRSGELYEKEDLVEMLSRQSRQSGNRFSDDELAIVRGALSFGDKTVGHVMTPRTKLKLIASDEPIGPLLMDNLHKTGQTRFLVVRELTKTANPEIVGTLSLDDLLNRLDEKGRVRDVMQLAPAYINEDENLRQALQAFTKTHQNLFVVINNFQEISGALSIEDLLGQILGQKFSAELADRLEPTPPAEHQVKE